MNTTRDIGMRAGCMYLHAVFSQTGCDAGVPGLNQLWSSVYEPSLYRFYTYGLLFDPSEDYDETRPVEAGPACSYRGLRTRKALNSAVATSLAQYVTAGFTTFAGIGIRHGLLAHVVRDAYAHGVVPYAGIELPVHEAFPRPRIELFDPADIYTQRDVESAARLHAQWNSCMDDTGPHPAYDSLWRWSDGLCSTVVDLPPEQQHQWLAACASPCVKIMSAGPQNAAVYGAMCMLSRIDSIMAAYTRTEALPWGIT